MRELETMVWESRRPEVRARAWSREGEEVRERERAAGLRRGWVEVGGGWGISSNGWWVERERRSLCLNLNEALAGWKERERRCILHRGRAIERRGSVESLVF